MNKDRMYRLADFLENLPPKKFSMMDWVRKGGFPSMDFTIVGECGTTACIAGWAVTLAYPDKAERDAVLAKRLGSIEAEARWWLELDFGESEYLFMGGWTSRGLTENDPHKAAAAIRQYADTGLEHWADPSYEDSEDADEKEYDTL